MEPPEIKKYGPQTLSEKAKVYKLLREEQGLSVKDASRFLGFSYGYAYQLENTIKRLRIAGDDKLFKSARRTLSKLIRGKKFGDLKDIKCSTTLAAAREVLERNEPTVKRSVNLNLDAKINPVDLSKYLNPNRPMRIYSGGMEEGKTEGK